MTQTYNDALEWAAKWIEDTLRAGPETDERTIEFGTNMAMTLRAARVQPIDDARVEEIRQRHQLTKFAFKNQVPPQAMADIDYLLSLLPQLSNSGPPSVYHCSCGAACTADEYIEHLLKGHDRGLPVVSSSERRCVTCGHTDEMDPNGRCMPL